jgi:hypothetical protein
MPDNFKPADPTNPYSHYAVPERLIEQSFPLPSVLRLFSEPGETPIDGDLESRACIQVSMAFEEDI